MGVCVRMGVVVNVVSVVVRVMDFVCDMFCFYIFVWCVFGVVGCCGLLVIIWKLFIGFVIKWCFVFYGLCFVVVYRVIKKEVVFLSVWDCRVFIDVV